MDLLARRRLLLDNGILPLIIWQEGFTTLTQIPVSYIETKSTLTIVSGHLSISGQSGPGNKSVSFTIPSKYIKSAKVAEIKWGITSAYSSCNVKIECDGQTLTDSATANMQTREYTPDISSLKGDMTITFTGDKVSIYTLVIRK